MSELTLAKTERDAWERKRDIKKKELDNFKQRRDKLLKEKVSCSRIRAHHRF